MGKKHPARICDREEKNNQQEQNAMKSKSKFLYNQSASKTHRLIWVSEGEDNLVSENKYI